MNRRTIVLIVAAAAIALFAGATVFYNNTNNPAPAATPEPTITTPMEQVETPEPAPTSEASEPAARAEAETTPAPTPRWNAYVREHSPVIGPASARVTIVEFFDPACEGCRAFYPIVHEIMRRHPNDVRLVLRYTPLHEGSDEAVRILETARRQNVFEPVLTALFQQQPQWADHGTPRIDLAWQAAGSAGLNVDTAREAMNAQRITAAINQDVADARTLSVRGTPTFFVNEKPLTNFGPQQLYDLVLSELAATQ